MRQSRVVRFPPLSLSPCCGMATMSCCLHVCVRDAHTSNQLVSGQLLLKARVAPPERTNGRVERALGVTELLMPLPGVIPGRGGQPPKKGSGAIMSIFELLPSSHGAGEREYAQGDRVLGGTGESASAAVGDVGSGQEARENHAGVD